MERRRQSKALANRINFPNHFLRWLLNSFCFDIFAVLIDIRTADEDDDEDKKTTSSHNSFECRLTPVLKVNFYQSWARRAHIEVGNVRHGNLSSPIYFIVETKRCMCVPKSEHLCMHIISPKKDMYKQFSLLILKDRNRHVIKERFLQT